MLSRKVTPHAESDLVDIWLHTSKTWSAVPADQYLDQLEAGMRHLTDHPSLGIDYRHILPGYRKLRIEHHDIFYRTHESEILVTRVLHEDMDAFARLQESGEPITQGLSLAGFLVWAAGLVYLLAKSRILVRTASPEVRSALEDELVQANRGKAFHAGYWAMLGAAAVMFAVSQFRPVSGEDAAHAVLIAGVAVPMYAFAILERVNA